MGKKEEKAQKKEKIPKNCLPAFKCYSYMLVGTPTQTLIYTVVPGVSICLLARRLKVRIPAMAKQFSSFSD